MSVVIGPPATRLLFENDDVKIWMMDVAPGEAYPHHYHHYVRSRTSVQRCIAKSVWS
ncbi:MAG: hypothetical protein ABIQ73_05240 [Acidimicrobiales bacterium]